MKISPLAVLDICNCCMKNNTKIARREKLLKEKDCDVK